jgi:hypothetical protein
MSPTNVNANTHPEAALPLLASRNYRCQCGQPVYFRNSTCLTCGTPLGYDCAQSRVFSLMPAADPGPSTRPNPAPLWQVWRPWQPTSGIAAGLDPRDAPPRLQDASGQQPASLLQASPPNPAAAPMQALLVPAAQLYKRCLNRATPAACNWLIPVQDTQDFCRACRLNRTIPDLTDASQPDNGSLWGLVETAKRRLVSSLIILGLPVASKVTEDPVRGLMFDLLRAPPGGQPVLTGHERGLITLNVDEADDTTRELARKAMREPYRTLLGHFRHEVGHYYWDRLVANTPWLDGFHQLFGNESTDYAASLQRHYREGPPANWPQRFVSAYASTHPWEDWAECWAHYLHMRDAIDTARGFGLIASLNADQADLEFTPFRLGALWQPDHPEAEHFLAFLNHWSRLTLMLNQMSRSMGQPDFYPFTLPPAALAKLQFIHLVVTCGDRPAVTSPPRTQPQPLPTA